MPPLENRAERSFARRFAEAYTSGLSTWIVSGNVDRSRFPLAHTSDHVRRAAKTVYILTNHWLSKCGALSAWEVRRTRERLASVLDRFSRLERIYNLLQDDRSRDTLLEVLVYRVLGSPHVRLSRNTFEYHQLLAGLATKGLTVEQSPFVNSVLGTHLSMLDLRPIGRDIRMHGSLSAVRTQYLLQQYFLDRGSKEGPLHEIGAGDIVVDGGACYGDTTLNFADLAGPHGRVLAFEFIPPNVEILKANLALNQHLADRIDVIENPLWNSVGEELRFCIAGPASRAIGVGEGADQVVSATETIDHVLDERGMSRVDFIKLDIEGAELRALKGAERSLRKCRPKLSVCLYHTLDDFVDIPEYLASLDLGYKFYIDHYTIHHEETVLFAVPSHR